jgi:hypothetical protein
VRSEKEYLVQKDQIHYIYFQTEEIEAVKPMSFFKILKYNLPEFWYIVIGCIGSASYGACPFVYGIAMGGIFEVRSFFVCYFCIFFTLCPVQVVLYNKLSWFISELPQKDISNLGVQCRQYSRISCRGLCLNYL